MDNIRKRAYKVLIYQAFLDIKNSGGFNEENFYRSFRIAHAFHNLAEFIIHDFKGFDEENFWSVIEALEKQYDLFHYKEIFHKALLEDGENKKYILL